MDFLFQKRDFCCSFSLEGGEVIFVLLNMPVTIVDKCIYVYYYHYYYYHFFFFFLLLLEHKSWKQKLGAALKAKADWLDPWCPGALNGWLLGSSGLIQVYRFRVGTIIMTSHIPPQERRAKNNIFFLPPKTNSKSSQK